MAKGHHAGWGLVGGRPRVTIRPPKTRTNSHALGSSRRRKRTARPTSTKGAGKPDGNWRRGGAPPRPAGGPGGPDAPGKTPRAPQGQEGGQPSETVAGGGGHRETGRDFGGPPRPPIAQLVSL